MDRFEGIPAGSGELVLDGSSTPASTIPASPSQLPTDLAALTPTEIEVQIHNLTESYNILKGF